MGVIGMAQRGVADYGSCVVGELDKTMGKKQKFKQPPNPPPTPPPVVLPPPKSPTSWVVPIIVLVLGSLFTVLVIQRPQLQAQAVRIICTVCDAPPAPPKDSFDYGAKLKVFFENTGNLGTTVISHNLSTAGADPSDTLKPEWFKEDLGVDDESHVDIGAHQVVSLDHVLNELFIYLARHGGPTGSSIGPLVHRRLFLFGHLTYRLAFWIPATTYFCFQYTPPTKGLDEGWVVCPADVNALVKSQR